MHIDHYNPNLKKDLVQDYYNLLLAQAHCNLKKGTFWPNSREQAAGLRVINPCEETDYGKHVFECPTSHRLWGATPTGKFHILKLDLNCNHFIDLRRERSRILKILTENVRLTCSCDENTLKVLSQTITRFKSLLEFFPRQFALEQPPTDYQFL